MKIKLEKRNCLQLLILLLPLSWANSQDTNYELQAMEFNTSRSEVATYFKDGLLYVYRNKPFYMINSEYYDLYTIEVDKGKEISKFNRLNDDINTKYNEGPVTFDEENRLVYVTRNKYTKKQMKDNKFQENPLEIDIYKYNKQNQFTFKEKFPFNDSFYSVAHACYSEITRRLYFTSNQEGGKGGTDIYYCDINRNGKYGEPVNLGRKINTKKEEKFTVVKDGVLYFSSNGHHRRKDLDIYYITEVGINNGEEPKHLEEPFNSNRDDFGIALINSYSGYLSSNRGHDQELNHNIFYFDIGKPIIAEDEFNLLLKIQESTREVLTSENFKVTDLDTELEISKNLVENGVIIEKLKENHQYEISFHDTLNLKKVLIGPYKKQNLADVFIQDTLAAKILAINDLDSIINETPDTLMASNNDTKNNIKKIDTIIETVEDTLLAVTKNSIEKELNDTKNNLEKADAQEKNKKINNELTVTQLSDIYFGFNESTLKEDSKKELDAIIRFLRVNGQIKLKIWAHADSRGSASYNQILSEKRAKSVYDYLIAGGINNTQILDYRGFGESKPLFKCDENNYCSPNQHKKNRRVDFVLVKR